MNMAKKYFDALDNILDKPIAFNPSFKKVTGSTNAALLLSQAFYWTKRATLPDGWFWKTREEWMEETGLTEAELDGAREKCRAVGVLEEKLKGVPATLHYRVNKQRVYELLGFQFPEIPESGLPGNSQIPEKPESGTYGDFNKETETPAKNTPARGKSSKKFSDPLWDLQHGKTPEPTEGTRLAEEYTRIGQKLEVGLRRGEFPQTPRAQAVYKWILKKEENGQSLDRFIQWAMRDEKSASYSWIYHKDIEAIKRDWPQAFPAATQNPDGKRASSFYG
jgi:hypothetical protein